MPGRRPKSLVLDPGTLGPILAGVMELVSRDRGQLPTHLVTRLSWLSESGGTPALVVLDPNGRARILPWEPHGVLVVATRKLLIEQSNAGDEAALEQLLSLEARYKAAVIGTDHRMTLSQELLGHLEIDSTPPARAFCYLVTDRIELYSRAANNLLLSQDQPALADLP